MAGSKATRVPNVWDRLRDQNDKILKDNAVSRRTFNPMQISIPPNPETPPAGNNTSDSGNFLPTAGGTMIGVIAFFPKVLAVQDLEVGKAASATSRTLDISQAIGADSTRILANGGVGSTDLEFIKGAQHAGQFLDIQGVTGQTLVIKNDASGNGSAGLNIRTQTGGDVFLDGNANILLIFDSTQNQWALISGGAGKAAAFTIGRLSLDQPTAGAIAWDLNFVLGDTTRIIDSATDGVWEIVDGIFQLESVLGLQMTEAGAGSVASCQWQSSTTEGGVFSALSNSSVVLSTFATGRPEITTQPHASIIVDTTGTSLFVRCFLTVSQGALTGGGILNLASFATIDFLEGGSGGGGSGATSLGQLNDVDITPDPPIANDLLQFNTTSGVWENQPASAGGGLLVDLSNLQAGAVPPVDMSLNNFDLENVTDIRMNAAGSGIIDNVRTLDFFETLHSIQSLGDRLQFTIETADRFSFVNGVNESTVINNSGVVTDKIDFKSDNTFSPEDYEIIRVGTNMGFNVPTNGGYSWRESDGSIMTLNSAGNLSVSQLTAALQVFLAANAGFTAQDGTLGQIAGDVIIGSGGNAVNITDLFNNLGGGSFADDTFNIFNAADPTKIATFNANAISTGNTRTYSLQNANGTLAMLNGVQQDFAVNVGFTNNNLLDVGGIFTTATPAPDIGQKSNYFKDMYINQIFWFNDTSTPPAYKIGGDTANGFDFIVPAAREFDFFFDGTGTTPSWVIRETVIDAMGGRLEDLEEVQFDGLSTIVAPSAVKRIGFDVNDFHVNMPTGGQFNWKFNGTTEAFLNSGEFRAANISTEGQMLWLDSGNANPSNGAMSRSGSDIFVATTNGIKNMKDIGAGGGGSSDRIESPDSTTTYVAGNTSLTATVSNGVRMTILSSGVNLTVPINMLGLSINMGTGDLTGVDDILMNGSGSVLSMNGGDITGFDTLQASNQNSEINMLEGTINMSEGRIVDTGEITVHQGERIKGNALAEFGIQLDNAAASVGTAGMLAMPVSNIIIPPTKAALDSAFGTHKGAMGFDTPSFPPSENGNLFVRDSDGSWYRFAADGRFT